MHAHILPICTQQTTYYLHFYIQCIVPIHVLFFNHFRHFTYCPLMERHYLPATLFLPGGSEEGLDETVTVSMVYIEPNAAEPTQDSTKDFTPRVETATVRERARDRDSTPRKPLRTEVRSIMRPIQDLKI